MCCVSPGDIPRGYFPSFFFVFKKEEERKHKEKVPRYKRGPFVIHKTRFYARTREIICRQDRRVSFVELLLRSSRLFFVFSIQTCRGTFHSQGSSLLTFVCSRLEIRTRGILIRLPFSSSLTETNSERALNLF